MILDSTTVNSLIVLMIVTSIVVYGILRVREEDSPISEHKHTYIESIYYSIVISISFTFIIMGISLHANGRKKI